MIVCRIVLDANVFISALINPEGPPGIIIKEIFEKNRYVLLLSQPILDELLRVLRYPKLRKAILFSDEQIGFWLNTLEMLAHHVSPRFTYAQLVPDDPKDDCYLIAAIEGKADFIVSGDKHLLKMRPYKGINILTPAEFLKCQPVTKKRQNKRAKNL